MIVLIDNYDSFTYNLYQYLGELGCQIQVYRNDEITIQELEKQNPKAIILSPGPCYPAKAGICMELIQKLHPRFPLLGVCLGHQAICEALGGKTEKAPNIFHGKSSWITHNQDGIFTGLENPLEVGRYHSLSTKRQILPEDLKITAETRDGVIMAVAHKKYPVYGIQFHPESVLTPNGKQILQNFLNILPTS